MRNIACCSGACIPHTHTHTHLKKQTTFYGACKLFICHEYISQLFTDWNPHPKNWKTVKVVAAVQPLPTAEFRAPVVVITGVATSFAATNCLGQCLEIRLVPKIKLQSAIEGGIKNKTY
jgi:hypothetical protein